MSAIRKSKPAKAARKLSRKPSPKPAKKTAKAKAAAAKAPPKKKPEPTKPAAPKPFVKAAPKVAKPEGKARKKGAVLLKPEPASREAKPGLGFKWICFQCKAKFYDLGKPDPICPRCGADQRNRPAVEASPPPPPPPRRPAAPPMARYLDDEEAAPDEAFVDEGEEEAAEIDIEAIEETGTFLEQDYEDE